MLGDAEFGLAGGAENMSRSPYIMQSQRWGQKMGDVKTLDMMLGALHCPFGTGHMGITAENVAQENAVTRADQDAFALESQNRAAVAIANDHFVDQTTPASIKVSIKRGSFTSTAHPKTTTSESLLGLRTVLKKYGT